MSTSPTSPATSKWRLLLRLFWEHFKISTIVIGGGYAIVMVADNVFGRRLKWLEEDELITRLPVFQTVPGLLATNSAIYVGVRVAGVWGGIAAVLGAALPSFIVITLIAMGSGNLSSFENPFVRGAFIGLRASMCGIVIAAIIKSWRGVMRGAYAWVVMPAATLAMLVFDIPPKHVLLTAIGLGIISAFIPVKKLKTEI